MSNLSGPGYACARKGRTSRKAVLLMFKRDHDNFKAFERNADRFVGLGPIVKRSFHLMPVQQDMLAL